MVLLFLLLLCVLPTTSGPNSMINELRTELVLSKTAEHDSIIPFLCMLMPSPEYIKAVEDDDLLSSILYELGFGVLGVRPNSWAVKYQANPRKTSSCFAALHSTATSEVSKTSWASSKKIIRRCCLSDQDL
jgi:hypothetical protein